MKSVLVTGTILLGILSVAYGQKKNAPAATNTNYAQGSDKRDGRAAPRPTSPVVSNQQPTSDQKDGVSHDQQRYSSRLFSPENLPNIGLFIAGIVGIIVAICTLKTIQVQTKAIQAQANAMVDAERAWVMVDLEKAPGMGGLFQGTSVNRGGPERHHIHFVVRCVCSNQGQTAARIIEKRYTMTMVDGDDDLPDSPNLDIEIKDPIPHYLRANGEPWHNEWTLEVEGVEFPGKLLVVYGVVRYKHMFSDKIAQTTFGYSVGFDGKLTRLIGKSKYNENT